jgi:hypothetical protein
MRKIIILILCLLLTLSLALCVSANETEEATDITKATKFSGNRRWKMQSPLKGINGLMRNRGM